MSIDNRNSNRKWINDRNKVKDKMTKPKRKYRIRRVNECLSDNSIDQLCSETDLCEAEEHHVTIRVYDTEELYEKLKERRSNQEKWRSEIRYLEELINIEEDEIIRLQLKISYLKDQ